jgi:ABC-type ATPase involved in cell division
MHLFEELNKLGTTVVIATHNDSLVSRFRHPQLRIVENRLRMGGTASAETPITAVEGNAPELGP